MEINKKTYQEIKEKCNEAYCDGMQGDQFVDLVLDKLKINIVG